MPINVMDAHYRNFRHEVVLVCLEKGVGVIGMESLGGSRQKGIIPSEAGSPPNCASARRSVSHLDAGDWDEIKSSSMPRIAAYVSD